MDRFEAPTQLKHVLDAMVALAAHDELTVSLDRLIRTAVDLVGATYGAVGVLDPTRTRLSEFVTVGLSAAEEDAIGDRPEGHGILGLLIVEPKPLRLPDLSRHPDSAGFPPNHPPMTSFLGVPLYVRDEVFGNLYLTDKHGGGPFTDLDEEVAIGLAAAAGVAIDRARLRQRVSDLAVLEDRERIARDLHDSVIQRLFATGLSLQAAGRLVDDPDVSARLDAAVDELDETVREVRSTIFELQHSLPARVDLRRRLLQVGEDLSAALGFTPTVSLDGEVGKVPAPVVDQIEAVVREALANVARHAASPSAEVTVAIGDDLTVEVVDSGRGPGPARPGGHGLVNLAERARQLGGTCSLEPAPGGGSRLTWRIPAPTGEGTR